MQILFTRLFLVVLAIQPVFARAADGADHLVPRDEGFAYQGAGKCPGIEAGREPLSQGRATIACPGITPDENLIQFRYQSGIEQCVYIDNVGHGSFFVPLNTLEEWNAFRVATNRGGLANIVSIANGCPRVGTQGCGSTVDLPNARVTHPPAQVTVAKEGSSYKATYTCTGGSATTCGNWEGVVQGVCTTNVHLPPQVCTTSEAPPTDIVFVLDASLSMTEELAAAGNSLEDFANHLISLGKQDLDVRLGFISLGGVGSTALGCHPAEARTDGAHACDAPKWIRDIPDRQEAANFRRMNQNFGHLLNRRTGERMILSDSSHWKPADIRKTIRNIEPAPLTPVTRAMLLGASELTRKERQRVLVLLGDGKETAFTREQVESYLIPLAKERGIVLAGVRYQNGIEDTVGSYYFDIKDADGTEVFSKTATINIKGKKQAEVEAELKGFFRSLLEHIATRCAAQATLSQPDAKDIVIKSGTTAALKPDTYHVKLQLVTQTGQACAPAKHFEMDVPEDQVKVDIEEPLECPDKP